MNKNIKWYKGWKNILTLISFLIYWPLAIVLMWVLASWSKKVKLVVTVVLMSLLLVSYFSTTGGGAFLFPQDPAVALQLANKIANYGFILITLTILTAIVLSIFRVKLGIYLRQIWIVTGIVLFVTFLVIMFSLLTNVQRVYQLTGQ